MQSLIGVKKSQGQRFLENGVRIPVTLIDVKDNCIIAVQTQDRNHYQAVQLGFSMKKNAKKAELGHAKGAKLEKAPKFLKEVRVLDEALPEVSSILNPMEILHPGDIVNVSGVSKGKGYAGVVKRHGFHGGPKTHGQSDRHRAPGAIGQGTTPGRVYKGKRMAGRMGSDNVTIRNLKVIDVSVDTVTLKGLVPGVTNGLIVIKKIGEDKKFVPLYREAVQADDSASQSSIAEEGTSEVVIPAVEDTPQAQEASVSSEPQDGQNNTKSSSEEPAGVDSQESPATQDKPAQPAESVENKGGSDNAS